MQKNGELARWPPVDACARHPAAPWRCRKTPLPTRGEDVSAAPSYERRRHRGVRLRPGTASKVRSKTGQRVHALSLSRRERRRPPVPNSQTPLTETHYEGKSAAPSSAQGTSATDLMYKTATLGASGTSVDGRCRSGVRRACHVRVSRGLKNHHQGVDGLLRSFRPTDISIAFDATSAYVHKDNSDKLTAWSDDDRPDSRGDRPLLSATTVNLADHIGSRQPNVNMVTCGGQAKLTMVYAVSRVQPVEYGEIVANVSSHSSEPARVRKIEDSPHGPPARSRRLAGRGRGHRAITSQSPSRP